MTTYAVILWVKSRDGRDVKQVINGIPADSADDAQAAAIAKLEAAGIVHGDICRIRRTDIGA